MKPSAALHRELDLWAASGRRLQMWWRDDGARTPSKPLDRLLSMARRYETPLTMAVIPDWDLSLLAARLACERQVVVIQNGADHQSASLATEPKTEFPPGYSRDAMATRLVEARAGLGVMPRFASVFAPRWKTVHPDLVGALRACDYRGLSGFGQDMSSEWGLTRIDVHLDLMDGATAAGFTGGDLFMSRFLKLARDRRRAGDWDQPIGVLTHHLDQDEAGWRFFDDFLDRMTGSPAVRWKSINDLVSGVRDQRVIRTAPMRRRATAPARLGDIRL
jgi:hypothetical protein